MYGLSGMVLGCYTIGIFLAGVGNGDRNVQQHQRKNAISTASKPYPGLQDTHTTVIFSAVQFNDIGATNLTVGIHHPQKMGIAITPSEPYEDGYIHFYSSVLQVGPTDYRLYYITKGSAGLLSHVALADNPRGPWSKPHLGIYSYPNSTAINATKENNIIASGVLVSVFITGNNDQNKKFGAIVGDGVGAAILYSADGFHWPTSEVCWNKRALFGYVCM